MSYQNILTPHGEILENTGFGYTLSVISGKYQMIILFWLFSYSPAMRFGEIRRSLGDISYKTLSLTLKDLEANGLINRIAFAQIPPKVEYSLTERGYSLIPILQQMCLWGSQNRDDCITDC